MSGTAFYPRTWWHVRWPGGQGSQGKGTTLTWPVKWPSIYGSSPVTHPGFTMTGTGEDFSRYLLDLQALSAAKATGISIRGKPVPIQMQDLLIWCNGIDAVQVYEPSGGNVYDLGITPPSSAPGLADQGTGSFAGTYSYAYRYKRSTTGEVSALSPLASHSASGAAQYIRVTIASSAESGVDQVEIFRTKTKSQGGPYSIVTQADTTTTYDDATADSAIDITAVPPSRPAPGGSVSIPVFDYIFPYLGRLWGLVKSTNSLHWSEPNNPWLIPALNQMQIAPQDRDVFTGFAASRENLFISKARHIYYLASADIMEGLGGSVLTVPDVRLVDDSTGFASQHATVSVENAIYFLSGEGRIYQIPSERGAVAAERAPLLEKTLKSLLTRRLDQAEAGYSELERKIYFAVSTGENVYNNTALVGDLSNNSWTEAEIPMESLVEFRDSDGRARLCFGSIRGDIGQLGISRAYGGVTGTLKNAVTSATANTLTDSAATYDSGIVGMPLTLFDTNWAIVQTNMVESFSGTTITTVWKWDTIPDSTYYYAIGGCFPEWKWGVIDMGSWTTLRMVRIRYENKTLDVDGNSLTITGKAGLFVATDDGAESLVDTVDLSVAGGIYESHLWIGGKKFQIRFAGLDGMNEIIVYGMDIEIDDTTEGGL